LPRAPPEIVPLSVKSPELVMTTPEPPLPPAPPATVVVMAFVWLPFPVITAPPPPWPPESPGVLPLAAAATGQGAASRRERLKKAPAALAPLLTPPRNDVETPAPPPPPKAPEAPLSPAPLVFDGALPPAPPEAGGAGEAEAARAADQKLHRLNCCFNLNLCLAANEMARRGTKFSPPACYFYDSFSIAGPQT
jgi:hypothetical protein